jgi:hypothetical protein
MYFSWFCVTTTGGAVRRTGWTSRNAPCEFSFTLKYLFGKKDPKTCKDYKVSALLSTTLEKNNFEEGVYVTSFKFTHNGCRDCRIKNEMSPEKELEVKEKLFAHYTQYPSLSLSDLTMWVQKELNVRRDPQTILNWIAAMDLQWDTHNIDLDNTNVTDYQKMLMFLDNTGNVSLTALTILGDSERVLKHVIHIRSPRRENDRVDVTTDNITRGVSFIGITDSIFPLLIGSLRLTRYSYFNVLS